MIEKVHYKDEAEYLHYGRMKLNANFILVFFCPLVAVNG